MKEENVISQDPPVNKAKVAEYLINLYDQNGYVLEEQKAFTLAGSSDIKGTLQRQYRVLGAKLPQQQELDSIYSTFIDEVQTEKKNLLQNTIDVLESSSVLEDKGSSSDSKPNPIKVTLDEDPLGTEKLFRDSMNRFTMDIFSMDADKASLALQEEFDVYGFKFSSIAGGRKIRVETPKGESKDFRLFTEEYRNLPGQTENIDQLAKIRHEQFQRFLKANAPSLEVDNLSARLRAVDSENIVSEIGKIVGKYDREVLSDLNQTLAIFDEQYNINNYLDGKRLDRSKVQKTLDYARQRIASKSEKFDTMAESMLDKAVGRYNINKANISSTLGAILTKTGAYSKIDINNPEVVGQLEKLGLSSADIPLDAIKVNGKARSLNYVISNILYDFDKVQAIRDGDLSIEFGDPKSAGALAPYVLKAKKTAENQKAFMSKHAGNAALRFGEEVGELGTDMIQSFGLSVYETGVNASYILYDSLKGLGMSDAQAESVVYGNTSFPILGGFRPEFADQYREEYLPSWDGDYLNSNFHEFTVRGSQDLSGSLFNTALFMIPGGQPIALGTTAVNAYGGDRIAFEKLQSDIEERRRRGYALSEQEQNIINMSDAKARSLSFSKAASETAFTYAFTGKLMKNYRKFFGLKSRIEKTPGGIAAFNKTYAKATRTDFLGRMARYTGLSREVLASEVPEEQFIMMSGHLLDIAFGKEKFDLENVRSMVKETGISSIFTSAALGKAGSLSTNRRARKMAVDILATKLRSHNENVTISEKFKLDRDIAELENKLQLEGKDPSKDISLQIMKNESLNRADRINRIEAEKRRIAEAMSPAERLEFFELMQRIEQTKQATKGVTDDGQQKAIYDKLDDYQEQGRKILENYPSELSYYFANTDTQNSYETKAIEILSKEAEAKGKEYDLKSGDQQIVDLAAKLYHEDLVKENDPNIQSYYALGGFIYRDFHPDYELDVNDEDVVKEAMDLHETLYSIYSGLDIASRTEKEFGEGRDLVVDQESAQRYGDILQEIKDIDSRIQEIYDNPNPLSESLPSEDRYTDDQRSEIDELENKKAGLQREADQNAAEFLLDQGDFFAKVFKGQLDDEGETFNDIVSRLKNIDHRMDRLSVAGLGSNLSSLELQTIKEFNNQLKDLKELIDTGGVGVEGKEYVLPSVGKMEAMLDAMDVVNEIYALSGGKINLSGFTDKDGTLTDQAIGLLNELATGLYTKAGLQTKDIMARTLFRDREVGAPFINLMNEAFRASAEGQNVASKAKTNHAAAYKKDGGKSPNSPENSMEMFILAGLKRELSDDGAVLQGGEFGRIKALLTNELELRKLDSERNPKDKVLELKYQQFKNAMDKLDVANANSYADVAAKASEANVNAVDRMASIMPGKRATDRINNFENYNPVEYKEGTYTPFFMKADGQPVNDYFGPNNSDQRYVTGSLRQVTRPDALKGGVRLNPEMFFDNVYKSYRGMEMDILARKPFETLNYIINSPKFESMIQGKSKKEIINSFKNLKSTFESDLRQSEAMVLDMESLGPEWSNKKFGQRWNKLVSNTYGAVSSMVLSRISQRPSQYYTALAGASVYLKNKESKLYLTSKAGQFTFFNGRLSDQSGTNNGITERVKDLIGSKSDKLSNIYMKSRTGLRNSVASELAIDGKTKVPIGYYISRFGLDPSKEGVIAKSLGSKATFDAFLDFVGASNELSLDLYLASADKLAANAAFESAYLDYRLSNGAKIGKDSEAWWANENKNPDLAAIRHADEVVAKTMRQTDQESEADAYSASASMNTKNAMRLMFPFGKFIMNARTDVTNNMNILLDPNVPQSQKIEAEKIIAGRVGEIVLYNAIKLHTGRFMIKGLASMFGFVGEEEDIEEYTWGTAKWIGEDILPVVSKEEFDPLKLQLHEATSWEQYKSILAAQSGFTEIEGISKEFFRTSRTFDGKFETKKDYNITNTVLQDVFFSLNPTPQPGFFEELEAIGFNMLWGEDIAREFLSSDLEKADTSQGRLGLLAENAGLPGLIIAEVNSFDRAYRMAHDLEIRKPGAAGGPTIVEHLSAPTDAMRERLIGALNLLASARFHSAINPLAPRADLNNFADQLERAIEKNFGGNKNKDTKLHELREGSFFPMDMATGIKEFGNISQE